MSGSLPVTRTGHQSYSLAKARIRAEVDEVIWSIQGDFGLTDLEVAEVLHELTRDRLIGAVREQQEQSAARKGAIGTPRQDEAPS